MEIVGRLTANAEVKTVKGDRRVVNFSVAVNDRYRPKGGEAKELVIFFNCSYWVSDAIARHLAKSTLVQLTGRLSVNAWNDMKGEAKATLNFHVNEIKLLGKSGSNGKTQSEPVAETASDDLPF
jgi:single-strand DNA-binding protein